MFEFLKRRDAKKAVQGVPAELYYNLFQGNPDGERVLAELALHFYDRIAPTDPSVALFMEGQRSVVLYVITKCQQGQK